MKVRNKPTHRYILLILSVFVLSPSMQFTASHFSI